LVVVRDGGGRVGRECVSCDGGKDDGIAEEGGGGEYGGGRGEDGGNGDEDGDGGERGGKKSSSMGPL
jgi:hypothetical protein